MKRTLTAEQREASDKRRAYGRDLVKQVKALTDDQRQQMARSMNGIATCEGHGLSLHNTCLLALQCPSATVVGGYQQWKRQGRQVKKGEHGHIIWIPRFTGKTETEEDQELQGFLLGTVFDIGQTEETAKAEISEHCQTPVALQMWEDANTGRPLETVAVA